MKRTVFNHIPNTLTLLRIFGSMMIFYWVYRGSFFETWKLIFLVILLSTDWLDGWLARRYHWMSEFGKILDPIADKILLNGLLITLIFFRELSLPPVGVGLILFREISITVWRLMLAKKGIIVPADTSGKIKTGLQTFFCITACIWIFGIRHQIWSVHPGFTAVFMGIFFMIVVITLFSGASMIWKFYFQRKHS